MASGSGRENWKRRKKTRAKFQKGDRVEFKEFPEIAEGAIVESWERGFYRVAWKRGLTYQGKTTIVSGNVLRKKSC